MTLATLYMVLAGGTITQFQVSPTTCHLLAEHYQAGGYFRVWDEENKRERWLNVDKAVCVEPVEVTRLQLERTD